MFRTFTNAPSGMAATNYYDDLCLRLIGNGVLLPVAVERVATAYLDGKPIPVGKKKLTKKERDSLFWSSNVVRECPPEWWNVEAMSFALARYLGQEPVAADGLVARVARGAPDALIRAVRYSGLVLNPHSSRRVELEQAAAESASSGTVQQDSLVSIARNKCWNIRGAVEFPNVKIRAGDICAIAKFV